MAGATPDGPYNAFVRQRAQGPDVHSQQGGGALSGDQAGLREGGGYQRLGRRADRNEDRKSVV